MTTTEYECEIWQDGIMQASVAATDAYAVLQEARHYERVYRNNGPVITRFYMRRELTRDKMEREATAIR